MEELNKAKRTMKKVSQIKTILELLAFAFSIASVCIVYYCAMKNMSVYSSMFAVCGTAIILGICFVLSGLEKKVEEAEVHVNNCEQCVIIIEKLKSKNRALVQIEPKDYEVYEYWQKMRDQEGYDVRFFAKVISDNEIEIKVAKFDEDIPVELEIPERVNDFIFFEKHYKIL